MITGNEPAMPFEYERRYGSEDQFSTKDIYEGLTIRQHFAAMALQGLCAVDNKGEFDNIQASAEYAAKLSVKYADALIAELNKVQP